MLMFNFPSLVFVVGILYGLFLVFLFSKLDWEYGSWPWFWIWVRWSRFNSWVYWTRWRLKRRFWPREVVRGLSWEQIIEAMDKARESLKDKLTDQIFGESALLKNISEVSDVDKV